MPKTLVLYHGSPDDLASLAEAVGDGVRSVRFAEVDVRRFAATGTDAAAGRHQVLLSADELAGYDGLLLGTAATAAVHESVLRLLADADALRRGSGLTLSVGAAFVAGGSATENDDARWRLLRALAGLGLVLVPANGEGAEAARKLGHRAAHVVSWITHARSHHQY